MTDFALRPAELDDADFLGQMLLAAAFWRDAQAAPDLATALADPHLSLYVAGWGRPGDRGLIASVGAVPVGAVWIRSFADGPRGYGFVAPDIPELSLAVAPGLRGQGVGRALLVGMVAQSRLDRLDQISLSVETDNPALKLYEQIGFEVVERNSGAVTMVLALR